jgi:hypothetical protein
MKTAAPASSTPSAPEPMSDGPSTAKLSPDGREMVPRAERRTAYMPVQVRRYRWLPFLRMDASLVDLSGGGFKLAFSRNVAARPGDAFWVQLDLVDGKGGTETLLCRGECRWYNPRERTLGGKFHGLTSEQETRILALIETLRSTGRLAC